jgi:hypothetical protein
MLDCDLRKFRLAMCLRGPNYCVSSGVPVVWHTDEDVK